MLIPLSRIYVCWQLQVSKFHCENYKDSDENEEKHSLTLNLFINIKRKKRWNIWRYIDYDTGLARGIIK